jgi:hypothetical protein
MRLVADLVLDLLLQLRGKIPLIFDKTRASSTIAAEKSQAVSPDVAASRVDVEDPVTAWKVHKANLAMRKD